jgi:hypothetical protein
MSHPCERPLRRVLARSSVRAWRHCRSLFPGNGILRGRDSAAAVERVSTNLGLCLLQRRPTWQCPSPSVSVSGKRDFATQRKRRRKGPSRSTDRQQKQSTRTKTHQFGAICRTPGNLCLFGTAWWGSEDSNFEPNDYEPLVSGAIPTYRGNHAMSGAGQF